MSKQHTWSFRVTVEGFVYAEDEQQALDDVRNLHRHIDTHLTCWVDVDYVKIADDQERKSNEKDAKD